MSALPYPASDRALVLLWVAVLATVGLALHGPIAQWAVGSVWGAGDLRPYVLVQFMPMLLIPAALLLRLRPVTSATVPGAWWWTALGCYAVAKGLEVADASVLEITRHTVSGHSLKHLVAALAASLPLHAACASRRTGQLR